MVRYKVDREGVSGKSNKSPSVDAGQNRSHFSADDSVPKVKTQLRTGGKAWGRHQAGGVAGASQS